MDGDGGSGTKSKLIHQDLTEQIIGAAIEVHESDRPWIAGVGLPGVMCRELNLRKLRFQREFRVPVFYKGVALDCGYRLDLIVEDTVILELRVQTESFPSMKPNCLHI